MKDILESFIIKFNDTTWELANNDFSMIGTELAEYGKEVYYDHVVEFNEIIYKINTINDIEPISFALLKNDINCTNIMLIFIYVALIIHDKGWDSHEYRNKIINIMNPVIVKYISPWIEIHGWNYILEYYSYRTSVQYTKKVLFIK
jgi:hypothetical protein